MADNGNTPDSGIISQSDFDALPKASANAFKKLIAEVKRLRGRVTSNIDETAGNIQGRDGGFFDTLNQNAEQINQIKQSLDRLNKEGLSVFRDPATQQGLRTSTEALDQLLGSAERGARTYEFLAKALRGFGNMTSVQVEGLTKYNKQTRNFTDALSVQAGILKELGFSFNDFQKNVDSAIYSFGLNSKEVLSFNMQIKDLANTLKMMPSEVSRNFQLVAKNLAYDFGTIKQEFVKLQELSLTTGVGTETLVSAFGKRMDTFQGASQAAAQINQLLGYQAFSGNELLTMTEGDRAREIRKVFMQDENLMSNIEAGGIKSKFALQTAAAALPGMDEDTVRRFILTGEVKDSIGKEVSSAATKAEQLKFSQKTIKDYEGAIKLSTREILESLGDVQRAQILARRRFRTEQIFSGRVDTASALGVTANLGPMAKGISNIEAARAFQSGAGLDYQRFLQLSQISSKLVSEKQLRSVTADLVSGDAERQRSANNQIDAIVRENIEIEDTLASRLANLSPAVRGAFDFIRASSPFTARVILGEMLDGGVLSGADAKNSDMFKQLQVIGEKRQEIGKDFNLNKFEELTNAENLSLFENFKEFSVAEQAFQRDRSGANMDKLNEQRKGFKVLSPEGEGGDGPRFNMIQVPTESKEADRKREQTQPGRRFSRPLGPAGGQLPGLGEVKASITVINKGPNVKEEDLDATVVFNGLKNAVSVTE